MGSFGSWLEAVLSIARFRAHFVNHAPAGPRWELRNRVIDEFHMVFIRQGRGYYRISGTEIMLEPGRLLFVTPGVAHSGGPDPRAPIHFSTTRFAAYALRSGRLLSYAELPPCPASHFSSVVEQTQLFRALFGRLFRHYGKRDDPACDRLCSLLLGNIVGELALAIDAPARQRHDGIETVRQCLREHPEDRLPVAALARMAGLSSKHFTIRFCECTGMTPNRFAIEARCERARELLDETRMSVKEIAYALGYPNPAAFSLQFTRFVGKPPSACRGGGCHRA